MEPLALLGMVRGSAEVEAAEVPGVGGAGGDSEPEGKQQSAFDRLLHWRKQEAKPEVPAPPVPFPQRTARWPRARWLRTDTGVISLPREPKRQKAAAVVWAWGCLEGEAEG